MGTPGVIYLMDFCGECRSCRGGWTNQCLAKRADMGFNRDGGYAPLELISERIFFPVDDDLPLVDATMLLDVMGTSSHALERALRVRGDIQSALITGAGPVGLGVLAMARLILGDTVAIIITDPREFRLELAARLGGTAVPAASEEIHGAIRAAGLDSVDLTIDTSGKAAARQEALNHLGSRGVMVCIGHGEGIGLEVSRDLIAPERTVLGSEYFCFHELAANLDRLRSHRRYLAQIITHRFPVEEIHSAFETFWAGNTGKVVVTHGL